MLVRTTLVTLVACSSLVAVFPVYSQQIAQTNSQESVEIEDVDYDVLVDELIDLNLRAAKCVKLKPGSLGFGCLGGTTDCFKQNKKKPVCAKLGSSCRCQKLKTQRLEFQIPPEGN